MRRRQPHERRRLRRGLQGRVAPAARLAARTFLSRLSRLSRSRPASPEILEGPAGIVLMGRLRAAGRALRSCLCSPTMTRDPRGRPRDPDPRGGAQGRRRDLSAPRVERPGPAPDRKDPASRIRGERDRPGRPLERSGHGRLTHASRAFCAITPKERFPRSLPCPGGDRRQLTTLVDTHLLHQLGPT